MIEFFKKGFLVARPSLSIRSKLMIAILGVVIVFGSVHILLVNRLIEGPLEDQFEKRAVRLAFHLASELEEPLLYDDEISVANALWQWSSVAHEHTYALVVAPDGSILTSTFRTGIPAGLAEANVPSPGRYRVRTVYDREIPYMDVAVPILGGAVGWLRLGLTQDSIRSPITPILYSLVGMIGLFILIAVIGSVYFSKLITNPVARIVDATRVVDLNGGPIRLGIRSGDELERLAATIEEMVVRLQTTHQRLEEASRRALESEKLASMGLLSSGVVHEVSNPLMGIETGLRRILQDPDAHDQIRKYVPLMLDGVRHIECVVGSLLMLARQDAGLVTKVDLEEVITQALALVHHRLDDRGIQLVKRMDTDGAQLVTANSQNLTQVLVNLLVNALDAMPNGGRLQIGTSLKDGFLWVEVEDNGQGIAENHLGRIWEPFYTTKPAGKGTGLGLAVTRSMIEANGGDVQVESQEGRGSIFRFSVPRAI
jgi:signal transduction histidine kinase